MFKNLSENQAELVKSLQTLGFEDEEIRKSLNLPEEQDTIEKSLEEKISEAQSNLNALMAQKEGIEKSEKPSGDIDFGGKLDEITKSLNDQIEKSNSETEQRFEGLTTLVKSLTDLIEKQNNEFTAIKEENEKLVKGNEDLSKSLSEAGEVLNRIAQFSPGLKSIKSGAGFVNKFEKSESTDGKEVLSMSTQKVEISHRLTALQEKNPEISKSLGDDIASFECSSRISPRLEKAFNDELNIVVVQ